MMNRIGIIGDVHAEDKALEQVLNFLNIKELDTILCTGDIVDGPGDVNVCFELLDKNNVVTVSGNHEKWILQNDMRDLSDATDISAVSSKTFDIISSLPNTIEIETTAGFLLLCHGLGENDMKGLKPYDEGYELESNYDLQDLLKEDRYRYIIGGHTHQEMVRKINAITFINPGSLNRYRDPSFLIIDFNKKTIQFYQIDSEGLICAVECHSF